MQPSLWWESRIGKTEIPPLLKMMHPECLCGRAIERKSSYKERTSPSSTAGGMPSSV